MANEKRLIDVNKVINAMQKCLDEEPDKQGSVAYFAFESIIECLKQEPTVDAVEVKHGWWIITEKERLPFEYAAIAECSECHKKTESDRSIYISGFSMKMVAEIVRKEAKNMGLGKYCPNCGAKMDGGNEGGV